MKVLRQVPGPRLFLYRDGEQARTVRVREVNALLCDVASCKVSLKDFRMLRASVNVVETLARTERGSSETRRKRQVKQAIEAGYIPGPRLFVATRAISTTGGYPLEGYAPELEMPTT